MYVEYLVFVPPLPPPDCRIVDHHFQTALDEAFISAYNLFYTSLPVLALGFFDQDVKPLLTFKVLP